MEDTYKLKIKLGTDEFEAEGPVGIVRAQFEAFAELISQRHKIAATQAQNQPQLIEATPQTPRNLSDMTTMDTEMSKITRLDGRVISLTARPRSIDEGVLIILLSQKILRENDSVTGAELMDGLTATGGFQVVRVDRLLEKAARDGDVIVIGEHRAKRYRLTNQGVTKARQIAADLIAIVA